LQGATTIHLTTSALAAGWRVGDEVLLPKSSQCPIATTQGACPDETEDQTIAAIADDGLSLTLTAPLAFDHPGARDNQGRLDFLPHVLNKRRNVIIRSENPNGVRGIFCYIAARWSISAMPAYRIWGVLTFAI